MWEKKLLESKPFNPSDYPITSASFPSIMDNSIRHSSSDHYSHQTLPHIRIIPQPMISSFDSSAGMPPVNVRHYHSTLASIPQSSNPNSNPSSNSNPNFTFGNDKVAINPSTSFPSSSSSSSSNAAIVANSTPIPAFIVPPASISMNMERIKNGDGSNGISNPSSATTTTRTIHNSQILSNNANKDSNDGNENNSNATVIAIASNDTTTIKNNEGDNKKIPQVDGPVDSQQENNASNDELGSDLDDDRDEEAELNELEDFILCTYEKVTRTKNKWRGILKNGIVHIRGKDYVFNRANFEFEW